MTRRLRAREGLAWVLVWMLLLAVLAALLPTLGFWAGTALIAGTGVASYLLLDQALRRRARHG